MPNKGRYKDDLNFRIKDVKEKPSRSALATPPPPSVVRKRRPSGES